MSRLDTVHLTVPKTGKELSFKIRPGTSDIKALDEVITRNGYGARKWHPVPGEQWLDIGANIGAFSLLAATYGASTIAFEPDPSSADLLRKNVTLNGYDDQITVIEAAAWYDDSQQTASFSRNTHRGNVWRNTLASIKEWQNGQIIQVDLVDIRPYWKPDYSVKMDIEGAEALLLPRLADLPVQRLTYEWSFEIHPSIIAFRDVRDQLRNHYDHVEADWKEKHDTWDVRYWFPQCETVQVWNGAVNLGYTNPTAVP